MQYVPPTGTVKLEFWVSGRGGEKNAFLSVPADWDDYDVKSELEEWRSQYFTTSDRVQYGYNRERDFGSRK